MEPEGKQESNGDDITLGSSPRLHTHCIWFMPLWLWRPRGSEAETWTNTNHCKCKCGCKHAVNPLQTLWMSFSCNLCTIGDLLGAWSLTLTNRVAITTKTANTGTITAATIPNNDTAWLQITTCRHLEDLFIIIYTSMKGFGGTDNSTLMCKTHWKAARASLLASRSLTCCCCKY